MGFTRTRSSSPKPFTHTTLRYSQSRHYKESLPTPPIGPVSMFYPIPHALVVISPLCSKNPGILDHIKWKNNIIWANHCCGPIENQSLWRARFLGGHCTVVPPVGATALSQFLSTKIYKNSIGYQPFYCCGWNCLNELQSTVEVAR
jgi:hypothetical protein